MPHDGAPQHWPPAILPPNDRRPSPGTLPGDGDGAIAVNFHPRPGEYGNASPAVIAAHMRVVVEAGIGVPTGAGQRPPA